MRTVSAIQPDANAWHLRASPVHVSLVVGDLGNSWDVCFRTVSRGLTYIPVKVPK
jgi:hypothetical protein